MLEALDWPRDAALSRCFAARLRVDAGRALLVTGRNGTGKTTLLRILAGLTLPAEGRVPLNGEAVDCTRIGCAWLRVRRAQPRAQGRTDGRGEPARAGRELAGEHADGAMRCASAHRRRSLGAARAAGARACRAGQRRRVGLARLALSTRAVWLLDEPATALDTAGLALLAQLLAQRLRGGGLGGRGDASAARPAAGSHRQLALA